MKHIIITFAIFLASLTVNAQNYTKQGNNYTQVSTRTTSTPEKTGKTYTIGDKVYDIYIAKTGSCYIIRTSKDGNQYKKYLGAEISQEICKELKRTYNPKSSK